VSFIEIAQAVHEIHCSQDLTSTACCDIDLWRLTFHLQGIVRSLVGLVNILCKFRQNCSSHSWDIVVTTSVRMNKQINGVDGQSENITSLLILGQWRHNELYQPSPSVEHTFVNRFSAVSTKESFHFSDVWRHTKISLTTFITNWFVCLMKAAQWH